MPRIPTYRSQVSPGTGAGLSLPRVNAGATGAQLGAALEQAGSRMAWEQAQRRQAIERAGEDAERMQATRMLAELGAQTALDIANAREEAPEDGAEHLEKLLEAMAERGRGMLAGLARPGVRAWAETELTKERARLVEREGAWMIERRSSASVRAFEEARELDANRLFTQPTAGTLDDLVSRHAAAIDGMAAPADVRARLKTESRHLLGRQFALGLAERDPYRARAMLATGELDDLLKPEHRAGVQNSVDREIRAAEAEQRRLQMQALAEQRAAQREARAAAATARAEARAALSEAGAYLAAGGVLPEAEVAGLARTAGAMAMPGTAMRIAELGARSIVNRTHATRSLMANATELGEVRALIARQQRPDPGLLVYEKALTGVVDLQRREGRADPVSFMARGGVAPAPLTGRPEDMRVRERQARVAAAQLGTVPMPLTSDEAQRLNALARSPDARERQVAIDRLGGFSPGMARWAGAQLSRDNPTLAVAAALVHTNRRAAQQAITGQRLLAERPELAPQREVNRMFDDYVGGALRFMPAAAGGVRGAAAAIWAAGGHGALNERAGRQAFPSAVDAALGAMAEAGTGGISTVNGERTIIPTGVSAQQFRAQIDRISDANLKGSPVDVAGRPVNAAAVRSGRFYSVGDNLYFVVPRGQTSPLRSADGAPWGFRVQPAGQR